MDGTISFNDTRPAAINIAIGEEFKVTAVATPGLTNLQGAILNYDAIEDCDQGGRATTGYQVTEVTHGWDNYECRILTIDIYFLEI